MKKKITAILVAALLTLTLSSCNRQVVDLTYNYDRAIICLPNGDIVSGKVEAWRDYNDGDQIQVKINSVTYLVHSVNVVLIKD